MKDIIIVSKKIAVGVAIYLVPTFIISGGLWAAQSILASKKENGKHCVKACEPPSRSKTNLLKAKKLNQQ
ncbi:MAG: hypothetical protein NW207_05310 [Cytophagales bacterium]|nr:hypothetical protein [Cytophagales bacterium]